MPGSGDRPDLLIAGGGFDPCLQLISQRARQAGLSHVEMFHDDAREAGASVVPGRPGLMLGDRLCRPRALFLRYDVFSTGPGEPGSLPKSPGWFAFALGAALADPSIALFNRAMSPFAGNKLADLDRARRLGLAVPETLVSNQLADCRDFLHRHADAVVKPVAGGGYCQDLAGVALEALAVDGTLPLPAFLQERLDYPEYRIYRIGRQLVSFRIRSAVIDYRLDAAVDMEPIDAAAVLGQVLCQHLLAMADMQGLDFCAFDLKTRATSGEACFLEVNSAPMFVAHDRVSNGTLARILLDELLAL